MEILDRLRDIVGRDHVLTGADAQPYARDWTGRYEGQPAAVLRPGSTDEVAAVVRLANEVGIAVVPAAGRTGLNGGAHAPGQFLLSVERLRRIRDIRPGARVAVVEAGVVLDTIHAAAAEHGLTFPLTFGARGSAMIGGALSTNAGGPNVLRYGNARALCLGIEAVLPTGEVLDLMTQLHKDNSGYDLRDLLIGAEGTLGIVTAAVLKLMPAPAAHATAMVALPDVDAGLELLNRLQAATGGAVEAFEYMPAHYIDAHLSHVEGARPPFDERHEHNVMLEIAASSPDDAVPAEDGTLPITERLGAVLVEMIEAGRVLDAHVARNEAERREIWARRELAGELSFIRHPALILDVALPLDAVAAFLDDQRAATRAIDPEVGEFVVSHLGDGNVHLTLWPSSGDEALMDRLMETVEEVARSLGGSFSAEHGIGLSKKPSMARRKDPVALETMRRIKAALDPNGVMNPGKVLP